ncbi:aminotransferase class IV [Myxococcota bacterium]|nr:aminotransferase class IV [Myxococcota bacterium]
MSFDRAPEINAWNGALCPGRVPPWPVHASDGLPGETGPFETIRLVDGAPRAFSAHRARLESAACRLGWTLPNLDGASALIQRLAPASGEARARLTLVEADSGEIGWALQIGPMPTTLASRRQGLHASSRPAPSTASPPDLKTVSRARALAAVGATAAENDVILVAADGALLEGTTWNVFAVMDGVLVTPPDDGRILPGVTRARVLTAARRLGISVELANPTRAALLRGASETFGSNALLPLAPLCSLDAEALPGAGPVVTRLLEEIDARIP